MFTNICYLFAFRLDFQILQIFIHYTTSSLITMNYFITMRTRIFCSRRISCRRIVRSELNGTGRSQHDESVGSEMIYLTNF